jgi:hypothetical protein
MVQVSGTNVFEIVSPSWTLQARVLVLGKHFSLVYYLVRANPGGASVTCFTTAQTTNVRLG